MKKDISWDEARCLLEKHLPPLELEITDRAWSRLVRYGEALEKAAPELKLTAVKSRRERVLTQFLESLVLAAHLPEEGLAADLGTGAGIPGLVVKIVRQGLTLTLLEAWAPRVAFMNEIICELGLSGIEARTVHLGRDPWPGTFDLVLARGFGAVVKFTQHAARCLRPGGQAFYLWRRDREPWGQGEPALRLLEEKEFPGMTSPLLIWEKD